MMNASHQPSAAGTFLRRAARRRHPGDVLRVVLGVSVLLVTVPFVHPDRLGVVETNSFRLVNDFPLPGWMAPAIWVVMQFGNFGSVPATAFAAGASRRWRLAVDFAVAGGAIYLVAKLIKSLVERGRPQTLLDSVHILGEPARGLGYVSGHSAVAIALATAAAPYLGRRARRLVWTLAVSVCLFRIYVGAHLPLDIVGGIAVGWAAGAAAHLILGAPEGHVSIARLRRALRHRGIDPAEVVPASEPSRRSASFRVTTGDHQDLFVKVVARERRDDDVLYRVWRRLTRRRTLIATGPAASQVEHEALLATMAARAGVRTPTVVLADSFGNGAGILVQEWAPGTSLADADELDVTRAALEDARHQVALLHRAGIAHGDLAPGSVLVDDGGQAWLVDFSHSSAAASDASLAADRSELESTLALVEPEAPHPVLQQIA